MTMVCAARRSSISWRSMAAKSSRVAISVGVRRCGRESAIANEPSVAAGDQRHVRVVQPRRISGLADHQTARRATERSSDLSDRNDRAQSDHRAGEPRRASSGRWVAAAPARLRPIVLARLRRSAPSTSDQEVPSPTRGARQRPQTEHENAFDSAVRAALRQWPRCRRDRLAGDSASRRCRRAAHPGG
jgi:hypothetical protein